MAAATLNGSGGGDAAENGSGIAEAVRDVSGALGAVDEVGEVIVPAVRVVVGDDDGGAGPVGRFLNGIDGVDNERLFVEEVGVTGMAVLITGGFQDADGGQVVASEYGGEVQYVVLVVCGADASVSRGADGGYRGGTDVGRIGGAGVVLERLVVRNIVSLQWVARDVDRAGSAAAGGVFGPPASGAGGYDSVGVRVGDGEVEAACEIAPGDAGCV